MLQGDRQRALRNDVGGSRTDGAERHGAGDGTVRLRVGRPSVQRLRHAAHTMRGRHRGQRGQMPPARAQLHRRSDGPQSSDRLQELHQDSQRGPGDRPQRLRPRARTRHPQQGRPRHHPQPRKHDQAREARHQAQTLTLHIRATRPGNKQHNRGHAVIRIYGMASVHCLQALLLRNHGRHVHVGPHAATSQRKTHDTA